VLGRDRTQLGRKFLSVSKGLSPSITTRGPVGPVTPRPTNRTFSLLAPQTLDPIWDSTPSPFIALSYSSFSLITSIYCRQFIAAC
jgi:hypothetical protein